jgi:putative hydroxymethylpyrimidine transport system permease protein
MGASRRTTLLRLRLPAALPAFASGARVAAAIAPIGAVIGEWVGASAGLGFVMLQSNAQMRVDLMFAALAVLAAFALAFYALIDKAMALLVPWDPKRTDR